MLWWNIFCMCRLCCSLWQQYLRISCISEGQIRKRHESTCITSNEAFINAKPTKFDLSKNTAWEGNPMSNNFSKSESSRLQSVTTQVCPKHLEAEHGRISAIIVTSVNLIYDTNILTLACETQYWWWKPSIATLNQLSSTLSNRWSSSTLYLSHIPTFITSCNTSNLYIIWPIRQRRWYIHNISVRVMWSNYPVTADIQTKSL